MSQTSSIQLRRGTGSATPGSLLEGELAINTDTGHLYYGSSGSDNAVSSSIGATNLFATNKIKLGSSLNSGATLTGSIDADGLAFINVNDQNLAFNISAGTHTLANSSSFITSTNGFGIIIDSNHQHTDKAFFVGHNNALPGISNYAPLMEISESGAVSFKGSITSSAAISASGAVSADDAFFQGKLELGIGDTDSDGIFIGGAERAAIFNIGGLRLQGDSRDPSNATTPHVTIDTESNITASGIISTSKHIIGQAVSASNDNINETVESGEYFHLVQNSKGKVQQDVKVKVLKITGQRISRIGSAPYTVFSAPGANKAIQIIEVTMFVDGTGTGVTFPASGNNPERNKLTFYAVPNDGVASTSFVPMGSFQRNQVNGATGRDSIITKHVPVNQMRLAINGEIKLRYGQTAGNNSSQHVHNSGANATSQATADYYFKIKYRVIDTTKDFTPTHVVEGTGAGDTPITL